MTTLRRNLLTTTTALMALAGNAMGAAPEVLPISNARARGDLHTIPRRRGSNSTEPHPATLSWQQRRKLAPGHNVLSRRSQNVCPPRGLNLHSLA